MTVDELRTLLASVPGDTSVWIHDGWTFPVDGCDLDDDGFIIFVDKDGSTATQTEATP